MGASSYFEKDPLSETQKPTPLSDVASRWISFIADGFVDRCIQWDDFRGEEEESDMKLRIAIWAGVGALVVVFWAVYIAATSSTPHGAVSTLVYLTCPICTRSPSPSEFLLRPSCERCYLRACRYGSGNVAWTPQARTRLTSNCCAENNGEGLPPRAIATENSAGDRRTLCNVVTPGEGPRWRPRRRDPIAARVSRAPRRTVQRCALL